MSIGNQVGPLSCPQANLMKVGPLFHSSQVCQVEDKTVGHISITNNAVVWIFVLRKGRNQDTGLQLKIAQLGICSKSLISIQVNLTILNYTKINSQPPPSHLTLANMPQSSDLLSLTPFCNSLTFILKRKPKAQISERQRQNTAAPAPRSGFRFFVWLWFICLFLKYFPKSEFTPI